MQFKQTLFCSLAIAMLSTAQTDDRDHDDPIDMTYYSDKDFKGYFDDGDSPEYDVTLGNGWCTNLREPRRMGDKHSSIKVGTTSYRSWWLLMSTGYQSGLRLRGLRDGLLG